MTDERAEELSRSVLAAQLLRRWEHTRGVAAQAGRIAHVLGEHAGAVVAAAWLHDIGYAAPLVASGFHPLDGARYLRDRQIRDRTVWTLVAHHTCAQIEADERGVGDALAAEFPIGDVDPFAVAALTYCDVTTSPDGHPVGVEERIAEILTRYPPEHVVHRAITRAAPLLRAQAGEVSALLETA